MTRVQKTETDTETTEVDVNPSSPEQEALIAAGAAPSDVDVNSLFERIQAMQARLDSLSAAQGIPSDPVAAQVKAVQDHVAAQANAHPSVDFGDLRTVLEELPDSDSLTTDDTELLKETVADYFDRYGTIAHDLGYINQLSKDLHRTILKNKTEASRKATAGSTKQKATVS